MSEYAALVQDPGVRTRLYGQIASAYRRTSAMRDLIFSGRPLAARRTRMQRTLELRDAGLRALHHHQVHLLARWRTLRAAANREGANALLPTLLLTIYAIASGLRTAGKQRPQVPGSTSAFALSLGMLFHFMGTLPLMVDGTSVFLVMRGEHPTPAGRRSRWGGSAECAPLGGGSS